MHSLLITALLLAPPPTRVETVTETIHGVEVADDYRWLEALEAESSEVTEWTTAQNDFTRSVLDDLPGRDALEARLTELMTVGQVNAPTLRGNHWFNTERRGDQNQPVLFVREGANGTPRVLLDANTLDDRGLYALDWYVPSPDGSLVAFGLSYAGDEMTVLHILETATGQWRADEIPGKVDFGGWDPAGDAFLYGRLEDPNDAYSRTWCWHELGNHWKQDPILYQQTDPSSIPAAMLSDDGRWIILQIFNGWAQQDLHCVSTETWRRTGSFNPVTIAAGLDARFDPEFVLGDTLYMFTTLDAPNGMIYGVDLNRPGRPNWNVILPEQERAVLTGISPARGRFVARYQRDVVTHLEQYTPDGESIGEIELPGLGTAYVSTHPERLQAFVSYESFNEPESIYALDLGSSESSLWARPDVPVDPSKIMVKQEWCTSKDGTRVPMFIVHRTDIERDGTNPTLIYGYGGFDVSITPSFNATRFPWLEAGGIYVVVTLRGGGEFGEAWHKGGMLGNKQNVFDDLYAATEYVIESGYTKPEHIGVLGGSNGGLLTGVAATQRPDLYAAVVSAVPLLDMVRFPKFLMAKFWVPEYGDPEKAEDFEWIYAYSPYHNIEEGTSYPACLFTAGENDNRVHPMHARKMAAAMQARAGNDHDDNPIMLWVDREGGHGQGKPLHLRVRDSADIWSFVMWQTGANPEAGN